MAVIVNNVGRHQSVLQGTKTTPTGAHLRGLFTGTEVWTGTNHRLNSVNSSTVTGINGLISGTGLNNRREI